MNELGRADVYATRRLRREQDFWAPRDLAGEERLLQVAARERAGARLRAGRPDIEFLDLLAREAADRSAIEDTAPAERWLIDPWKRHRFRQRQRADHACRQAI